MKRFQDLTPGGQFRRMRGLAEVALGAYDLQVLRLSPLQHWLNTTFRVDARSPWHDAGETARYTLRIHRPGFQTAAMIRSELLWLAALCRETDLVVPEPVPTREGALLTTVATAGVPEPRHCVVLRWVPGRFRRTRLGATALEQVGTFMARLHRHAVRPGSRHAEGFVPPDGFVRQRWDHAGILGRALGVDAQKSRAALAPHARRVLDATAERVREAMETLGEGPGVFGLIHADLHQGNYLFHQGAVCAIDFDTAGWGHYVYDVAVTFSTLRTWKTYPALRAAFLRGYRRVRPLSPAHEAHVETFIAARLLAHTLWLAGHLDEPMFRERAPGRVAGQVEVLERFLGA
jgi:Ser/Thr protein kinase RdoA (MazF antagonist)